MSNWEIALWTLWILWGLLTGFGLWLMYRMDQDDRYEDADIHWRADQETVWTGHAIIYGWIAYSIVLLSLNIYWHS